MRDQNNHNQYKFHMVRAAGSKLRMFCQCISLMFVYVTGLVLTVKCQECDLPNNQFLGYRLQNLAHSLGDERGLQIMSHNYSHFTCLVQSNSRGKYKQVSVVMNFTVVETEVLMIGQFEIDCMGSSVESGWDSRSGSLIIITHEHYNDIANTGLWTNCSSCSTNAGNDNHCNGEFVMLFYKD